MSRALDDLVPELRVKAFELIARCAEAGIPVFIVDTLRTPAEQDIYLRTGASWTTQSKHLTGRAIDICPYELYTAAPGGDKLLWNIENPMWEKIVKIGERLGLRAGARWTQRDYGHFELPDEPTGKRA
jgi:hypothetical protein